MQINKKIVAFQYISIVVLIISNYYSYFYHSEYKNFIHFIYQKITFVANYTYHLITQKIYWILQQEYDFSLNNREKAFLIIIISVIIFAMIKKKIRKAFIRVLVTLFDKNFVRIYIEILIYTGIICYLLYKINLWKFTLTKDTFIWIIFSALILSYKSVEQKENEKILLELFKSSLTVAIVYEFLLNIYTFNLFLELFFIILIIFISMLIAVIDIYKEKEKYAVTQKLLNRINIFIGLTIFLHLLIEAIKNYKILLSYEILLSFILPIILTFTFLPYLGYLVIYVTYQDIFVRLKLNKKASRLLKYYFKIQLLLSCSLNRMKLQNILNNKPLEIMNMTTRKEVLEIINN